MASRRSGRHRVGAASVLLGALILAGCGKPAFTYVANSTDRTYFKVPSSWQPIDQQESDDIFQGLPHPDSAQAAAMRQLIWSAAYDSAQTPDALHLIGAHPATSPAVYASVRHLIPEEQDFVSIGAMRNYYLPVDDLARQEAAQQGGFDGAGFEKLGEAVLTPSDGMHGIRVIFNYQITPGVVTTFDKTMLANNDSSILYTLWITCTARCYRDNAVQINDIATSFTVRSRP